MKFDLSQTKDFIPTSEKFVYDPIQNQVTPHINPQINWKDIARVFYKDQNLVTPHISIQRGKINGKDVAQIFYKDQLMRIVHLEILPNKKFISPFNYGIADIRHAQISRNSCLSNIVDNLFEKKGWTICCPPPPSFSRLTPYLPVKRIKNVLIVPKALLFLRIRNFLYYSSHLIFLSF